MNRRAFIRSATGALLVPAFPAIVRAITPQQRAAILAARPKAPVVAGGGGGGFTFLQGAISEDSDTVSLNGVGVGHLIVLFIKGYNGTLTSISDGTSNLTLLTEKIWDLRTRVSYLLSSNSGDRTYTATNTFLERKGMIVMEFSASGTASFDTENSNAANNGLPEVSGTITTTGTNEVIVGFVAGYSNHGSWSNGTIGGVSANMVPTSQGNHLWGGYRQATLSEGQFSITASIDANYNSHIAAFKC